VVLLASYFGLVNNKSRDSQTGDTRNMFVRLSKFKKHSHIAYLSPSGEGQSSMDGGHSHSIVLQQSMQETIDPQTGMPVMVPVSGGLVVSPAGVDGHSHDLLDEITAEDKKPSEKDEDVVSTVKALFKAAKEDECDSREEAEESEKFYRGGKDQWEESDRNDLQAEKRPALTFNEIEAKIDLLSGYQRQNRLDIRYFPTEEGDARVADILTAVVKNINEQCNFDHKETKAFEDEMIVGRGLLHTYIDYDDDIRGTIKTERFPWMDAYFGPHEEEDLSDCEHVSKARWFSKAKCKQMWPEKAKNIEQTFDLYDDDKRLKGYPSDQYEHPDKQVEIAGGADPDYVNIARKEIRVIETTYKEYAQVTVLAVPEDDVYLPAKGWDSKDIAAAKTIPNITAIPRKVTRFRVSTIGGDILLDDFYSDLEDFAITPIYAKKRGNFWWGKIKAVKDPQREINKRRSVMADIMNRMNGYGRYYDDQTFPDAKEEKNFKKNVAKAGFVQKITDAQRPPHKEDGTRFPAELANSIALDSQKIRDIMNVNVAMMGQDTGSSGVALARSERQGVIGNEFLFDNLSLAKRRLGRLYIPLIQKVYTPERIMRLILNRMQKTPVEIGGKKFDDKNPMDPVTQSAIMQLLETTDLGKHDVVVGEMKMSPTMQLAYFSMFSEMAGKGAPIPPSLIIKLSPLPDKEKQEALQAIEQQQQQSAAQEKAKFDTEIQKTLIAKQGPGAMGMGGMPQ